MKTSVLIPMVVLALSGCTSKSTETVPTETVRPASASEAHVKSKEDVPVEFRTPDGRLIPFHNGEAVFGDQIAIVVPSHIEVFRQPQVVTRELDQLPYLYLKKDSLAEVVTQGFQGEPYVDPQDKSFCWTARTCRNPKCPSRTMGKGDRPYLFVHAIAGITLRADGRVDSKTVDRSLLERSPKCPVCGLRDFVEVYEPADVAQRKQALIKELTAVRAAREAARAPRP